MESFDAIIVGTGQAGPSLANRFHQAGRRVAIIERDRVGGTCVNWGCIPTKALVASARVAHMARRSGDFGVETGDVRVDMRRVHARMAEISGHSNRGVEGWLEGLENVTLIRGDARFESARSVRVGDRVLEAEQIFLNVGGRAVIPDFEGIDRIDPLTSVEMLALEELPQHLVVVGGSYIGLELGQIFRRFGSEVTIVERNDRLIHREDPDVSAAVEEILAGEGIRIRTSADCFALDARDGGGAAVRVSCEKGPEWEEGSHVLFAVGRRPNTDTLELDRAGLETDARGYLTVDDELRTNVPGIWAIGDCNGRGAFTHTAYNDYEIVAANLFDNDTRRVSDRIPCYGLYVDPPLGRIGMTETEARQSGREVWIGTRKMSAVGRARERSEMQGFMKILVDAESEQILGASILGIRGDEVVQTLLALMYAKASYKVLARSVPIHPTVAELLPTVLQGLRPLD